MSRMNDASLLVEREEYRDALIEELNDYLYTRYCDVPMTHQLTGEIEAVLMQWSQFHTKTISSWDLNIDYNQPYPRVLLKELVS